ncbi:MAG: NADH-quinone oxidoreductase subunit NuoF, partial [Elusimicrobium sp.]|nr:NADH-quinone oxidoreductase subunit NuoF [Elusimicrobium sp.]
MLNTKKITNLKEEFQKNYKKVAQRVTICGDTSCASGGSLKVYDTFKEEMSKRGLNSCVEITSSCLENSTYITKSGCQGFCSQGPLVEVNGILYVKVKPEDVSEIIDKTILKGEVIDRLLYLDPKDDKRCKTKDDILFYKKQHRILLADCGRLNPEDIGEYIASGGFQGLIKAFEKGPEWTIEEMKVSGLRGRGGGGFPTGLKWSITRASKGKQKYMICNGDEGDPGAYMDRSMLEGNPYAVIEGMMIAGCATGASKGLFYIRAEYPNAFKRIQDCIDKLYKLGMLGKNILGSGFNYDLEIRLGAGAFVCGEETALIASIEGRRGMPSPKPPFPSVKGLWGCPTTINNVETLAAVPYILRNGGAWYAKIGTEKSKGTKVFAMTGKSKNTGLIEIPLGATVKEAVYDIGGGPLKGEEAKAVQTGGPSGGVISKANFNMPITYESLQEIGSIMGSGGLIVMDETDCMVDISKFYLDFCVDESCGKCAPCRIGSYQLLDVLERITSGKGEPQDIEKMESIANAMKKASLCGLGQTAPNPVLSTLRFFREEYDDHILRKKCPTGKCGKLITYEVITKNCVGCGACKRACPVTAITGEPRAPHIIDQNKCI